jgi:hypothetical protein
MNCLWRLISLFGCDVCRGYQQRIRDVYDARIAVLSRALDQAGEGGNLFASSWVHEGHPQEVQDGWLEAPIVTDEYNYSARHDEDGEPVDQKEYRSMIGSLLYLTATRPDIKFSMCLCTHFQASPRTSHRQAIKRIFRYLRYTPELGLWYSASSCLSLLAFPDADFTGCLVDRKSTSGTYQFLGSSLVSWSSRK